MTMETDQLNIYLVLSKKRIQGHYHLVLMPCTRTPNMARMLKCTRADPQRGRSIVEVANRKTPELTLTPANTLERL